MNLSSTTREPESRAALPVFDERPMESVAPPQGWLGGGSWKAQLLTALVLVWVGLLVILPTVSLVFEALGEGPARLYKSLTHPDVLASFRLTLVATLAATALNTVFGLMIALTLARQSFVGRGLADALLDLPFAVSPVIAGLLLILLYGPMTPVGGWLDSLGIGVIYHPLGLVIATAFVTLPFVAREVVPVLREFGIDQEEVAHTLGAGRWTTFRRITLPSIRWGLAYGVLLTIARGLGEFGAVLVVSGNILGRTQTTTLYIHDAVETFNPQGAAAASLVLGGVSVGLLLTLEALRERVERRECHAATTAATKGESSTTATNGREPRS